MKTTNFVRLYLDVGSLASSQCDLAGDDDISLSSVVEDEKHDGGDEEGDKDSDRQNHESNNAQTSIDDKSDEVVDLTASPQVPQHHQNRQPLDTVVDVDVDVDVDGDPQTQPQMKLQRLVRIAKKFKKQYLQKSAQYKEQYTERRKLSDRVRHAEGELSTVQEQMADVERSRDLSELKLNESQLSLLRIRRERDNLKSLYSMMAKDKSRAEARLTECHSHYAKELEAARVKSMSEVQEIMEEHPKVVEENRVLKQRLQKLNRSLSRGDASGRQKTEASSRSQLKDINKALREMDQQLRSNPKTVPTTATAAAAATGNDGSREGVWSEHEKRSGGTRAENPFLSRGRTSGGSNLSINGASGRGKVAMKEINGRYSSLASRMIKASQKAKRPPQNPANGRKRSSIESLSLSGNKRTKSYSASRREFFQRKP